MSEEDNKIAASRLRLGEQAALMLNLNDLLTKAVDNQIRQQKVYNNFAVDRSGGTLQLTKALFRNDNVEYLSKLPGHILSLLQPSIKLYKVLIPDNKSQGIQWRIPFDDTNFKFQSNDKKYKTSQYVGDTLNELISGTGRMHGAGIKSFSYKYEGTNPAEVNTNISAELSLYFQDVRDIVKEIQINKDHPNYEGKQGGIDFTFSYADLVADSPRNVDGKPNTNYYRIKIIVGYAEPNEEFFNNIKNYQAGDVKKIIEAVRTAKLILYLTPHNHDLTFEENGAITINIKYIASMASVLSSLDILSLASENTKKEKEKAQKDAGEKRKTIEKQKKENRENNNISKEEQDKRDKELDKQLEVDGNEAALENARNRMYSEVFRQLIGIDSTNDKGKIYSITIPSEALDLNMLGGAREQSANNIKTNPNSFKMKSYGYSQPSKSLALVAGAEQENTAADAKKAVEEAGSPTTAEVNTSGTEMLIKFIFLGDLIDIFCKTFEEGDSKLNALDKPRLIFTNLLLDIPTGDYSKMAKDKLDEAIQYQRISVNLADLPISLSMLHNFFIEKIVKPRRDSYALLTVLYDILSDVIGPAVSPSVFGKKTILNKKIRMSTGTFSCPFINSFDVFSGTQPENPFKGDIKNISDIISKSSTTSDVEPFGNYVVFYCSNQLPDQIIDCKGNYTKDKNIGIYHFCIGSDIGLIKKITFKKTDTPFYKEAKAQGAAGNQSLIRLREVYDVDVSMFGNNIYRPGEYIYIEPLFFTGKVAVDLQTKLGLGGYYQIIDVSTKFNENTYDTSISAVLYAHVENNEVITADGRRS